MSNIGLIIEERAADLGNFLVGRLLPFRQKRMVGPFIFIDHMGPAHLSSHQNLDVGPHPHIGLATLTYLFEGAIMHKDTLGNEMEIQPGAVNWMTAGKGIVHSERTPDYLRTSDKFLHGLQIWIALPKELEQIEPNFTHVEKEALPFWENDGVAYRLIAGKFGELVSPVPVYSDLHFLEIKSSKSAQVNIGEFLQGESGMYILQGKVKMEGEVYEPKQLLVAKDVGLCAFEVEEDTILYIFGGEPFPEERHIFWNFVSSDKALIEKAKEDWKADRFPHIEGETERVPMPEPFKK